MMRQVYKWAVTIGMAAPFGVSSALVGAVTLPVPCAGGACGVSAFVSAGQANAVRVGSTLTINQASSNATLNWQSFDISADGKVQFVQPSSTAVALNRIYQADPSQIAGTLTANGRVFLINQNGIIFGQGAQVNVGGLLASTLDINTTAATSGLVAPAAFSQAAFDAFSNGLASGDITIGKGATITTAAGGQVLVFAPNVTNEGTISTPGGQTVLAAGSSIYLASNTDPSMRGLLVEVGGTGGNVTNGVAGNSTATSSDQLVGQILAKDGNVTLAGLAVNQLGRVSATTSINENGSIILQAGDGGTIVGSGTVGDPVSPIGGRGGTLTLGTASSTDVTLDGSDPSTTIDSNPQLKSAVSMTGNSIQIDGGALVRATSGIVTIAAQAAAQESVQPSQSDGSRLYVAPGATIDVSGASTTLPVSVNVIPVQLRGSELANSPLQQNGPLRGQTIYVDIRQHGTRADGTPWQGTPLADVSGEIAAIGHNVAERNLTGGTISLQSHGDLLVAAGSTLNLAGGKINYVGGTIDTTKLLTAGGKTVDISAADPNAQYIGIANSTTAGDPKWGTSATNNLAGGSYVAGYTEGKDAGSLRILAPTFVLDGNVNAATVAGIYQRRPDQPVASPTTGAYYRAYDQVPMPASLTIGTSGNDFVTGNVTIAPTLVLPGLLNSNGSPFDPITDPLPASVTSSILRPSLLGGSQGFGNVTIYANGKFIEPNNVQLALPAGGSFNVTANIVTLDGGINVPGGTIAATAEPTALATSLADVALTLGTDASLTVGGAWVNDSPLLYPGGNFAPLYTSGGSITLQALSNNYQYASSLDLLPGSRLDVSGGAQLTAAGKLLAGNGGSINLVAGANPGTLAGAPASLELGATLSGYALYHGGSLSVTASGVCIATSDCGATPTELWLSPAFFQAGGFGNYSLTAAQGGMNVAPGTIVTLRQQNLQLPANYQSLADAPTLDGLAPTTTLIDRLRTPVSLSLTQAYPATSLQSFTNTNLLTTNAAIPSFVVGTGAEILADPGASLSLSSNIRLLLDGTLSAPGGQISLSLLADQQQATYDPTQAIWIGSHGVLDAAGTTQLYVNAQGERTGTVFAGGTVSLDAARGYVEVLPGSLIDVAGTSGTIDVSAAGSGIASAKVVASAGGSVAITAAEGAVLGGTLEAAAGVSGAGVPQPAGGSFSLTLNGNGRNDYGYASGQPSTFFQGARQIDVAATQIPLVIGPGTAIPSQYDGQAFVSANQLQNAGFDSITLTATPLSTTAGVVPGVIDFTGNVALTAGRSITLDSASYNVAPGVAANVAAPYVEFGNSDQLLTARYLPTLLGALAGTAPATGALDVSGQFVELYGTSVLVDVGSASFASSGDLRLRGLQDLSSQTVSSTLINGALYLAGDLSLRAEQIYPSSLSQFTLSADPASLANPTSGSIEVGGSAGPNTGLLSAGGALTLSAGTVTQDGVLRAPFGSITIDAQSLTLGAGSLTSTSAQGLTIPFGTTQGGLDWVYPLAGGLNLVYGASGITPPAQHILLQGTNVDVAKGAVVDVSGGGNLQAYEWIPGVGGTNDVLSASYRPTQFAILPSLGANVAPFDPQISSGTSLQVGDAVYLAGAPGLAAGVYQLLPARYALLPGAFLVTPVAGYQDIQSGQAFNVIGGGTIVSGYHAIAGTAFGDSRTSGFEVVPASVVLQQAQYTTTGANQFFANQAATAGVAPPPLPMDSGILALGASQTLGLDGSLITAPGAGGIGAEVDIASANILVAGDASASAPSGTIVLSNASLDALNAQTLLLGGVRSDGVVTTTAQSVEVGAGVTLSNPTVLLTGRRSVTVDAGASLRPTGTSSAARPLALSGDGAFLDVSAGAQDTVARSGASGAQGVLTLAAGSTIGAPSGSIYLDATQNVIDAGALSIANGNLAVSAPIVALGTPTGTFTGAVLGPNLLGAQGLRNLTIQSGGGIDLFGSVDVSAQNITLDAPGFVGFGAGGDSVALTASGTIALKNSAGLTVSAAGGGSGALALSAANLTFTGGSIGVSGFSAVTLNAAQQVAANAAASFNVGSGGTLDVSTSRVTTAADVALALAADGAVAITAPAQPATLPPVADLGGSLSISGASVAIDTALAMPSGRVTITADGPGSVGNIDIGPSGAISVAGLVRDYAGTLVPSPGGTVSLGASGNVNVATHGAIDVSGASGGAGGSLAITATTGSVTLGGTLTGTGAVGKGASFAVDAQSFGDFATLNQALNGGGFQGAREFHLRGPGDLTVAAGAANAVTAQDVALIADQGGINVAGVIDASGASGGNVLLAARDSVSIGGTIDAHATQAGGSGGTVAIDTTSGGIGFGPGATIAVGGAGPAPDGSSIGRGGTVVFRAPRDSVASSLNGSGSVQLAGTVTGSARTTLEAFTTYQNTSGQITAADEAAMNADATNFLAGVTPSGLANLGTAAASPTFVLAPGIEIDATSGSNGTGTLALDSPWNLFTWRYGPNGVPGILTLRAQGGITFSASLSDGFAATSGTAAFTLPSQPTDSWSYRIVGGADFGSADPLAVTSAATPADVTIAACGGACTLGTGRGGNGGYTPNMVRTGDGFIDVAASGNFVLGSQASLLYTAGEAGPGIVLSGRANSLNGLAYPTNGGNISIDVGANVVGAPSNQFVNAWLWRLAPNGSGGPNDSATAWSVSFASFQQGVGALGGGDVTVRAGGDVRDLSASVPSIGVQVGGTNATTSVLDITGGGTLTVNAGGSIDGGSFYAGLGSIDLTAGNRIGASALTGNGSLIGLGNASLTAVARDSVAIADVLNPTLLNLGAYQTPAVGDTFFSTYGTNSAVNLTAIGGAVALNGNGGNEFAQIQGSFFGGNVVPQVWSATLGVMPPTLTATALSGDINVGHQILLSPAPYGNLRLLADGNVNFASYQGETPQVYLSDADPALLPSLAAPQATLAAYTSLMEALATPLTVQHAAVPVHTAEDLAGLQPAQVVARTGSVLFPAVSQGNPAGIWSAKPIQISAALDISNLDLIAQNLGLGDVTSITAGRDLIYPLSRQSTGGLAQDTNGITVDGPGQLNVAAGRNVDLGTSSGIVSRANLVNTSLPATGASISVDAGTLDPQFAAFINQYVEGADTFDAQLIAYVESVDAVTGISAAQAKQTFAAMRTDLQRAFVESVFFDILRTTGRAAAASGNGNFSAAFAAIQNLFPGANPAAGQTNPYTGNINLYFSRIYSEQGGNVSLLAPGGDINVGLAIAPAAFSLNKQASDLGIVARTTGDVNAFSYNDFQVNQSRVFAADGGNILVWSTDGNIDAGRGAKTAISAPALNIAYDPNGQPAVTLRAAIAGSGIQALAATPGVSPGNVDLFAPHGVVNANDAGIVAGNLTIAATAVLGANNITVTGTSVGVPVVVTGAGASVAGAAATVGSAANVAESGAGSAGAGTSNTPAADTAISWLDVFVTGLGADNCKPDDLECLKRQNAHPDAL